METTVNGQKEVPAKEEKSGKRKWLSRFTNFLLYGGWLLIVIFIVGVVILISYLG